MGLIRRIQVLHYRGLKYIDVKLSNFQILIGPNASGKSTFLDVINLLRDILNDSIRPAIEKRASSFGELIYNKQGNGFEIALELEIPTEVKQNLENKDYSFVRYEISLQLDNEKGVIINNENVWLIKELSKEEHQHSLMQSFLFPIFPGEHEEPESLIPKRKHTPVGWRSVISKTPNNDYFRSENTKWNMTYRFGPLKSSLVGMPEDEERFPVVLWTRNFLMEGIQFLQLDSSLMRWSCRPDAPLTFQTDGSNLPKVIQHLNREKPDFFARWLKHVQSILPDIIDIKIKEKTEDRSLYLNILYRNNLELPSWLISDGTLRLLAQTIIAYLPERDKIYMIEEPENGLHPLAIEGIFQSLSSVYENQILLATHSPAILRLTEPSQILCFSKAPSGAVDIVNGQNHPRLKDWKKDVDLATLHAAGVLQ
jgi:predicted ATPase